MSRLKGRPTETIGPAYPQVGNPVDAGKLCGAGAHRLHDLQPDDSASEEGAAWTSCPAEPGWSSTAARRRSWVRAMRDAAASVVGVACLRRGSSRATSLRQQGPRVTEVS